MLRSSIQEGFMRSVSAPAIAVLACSLLSAQTPAPPQTARQALIEMFFGSTPNHLEKHLPDATRKTLQKLDSGDGRSLLSEFSMLSAAAKAGGANLQTFDTGPTLVSVDQSDKAAEHVEITVERDDLMGDEDQIELALHVTTTGKEQTLPFIPRFTFSMKSEADVWRLNEISVTVRVPLADPDFLKTIEDRERAQNEQTTIWSLRTVAESEKAYSKMQGSYACSLSALAKKNSDGKMFFWDTQLASGNKGGYIYAISNCDASHYKIVAEPAVPDSGQRAFCADEGGTIRAAADGKAITCLSSGETVEDKRLTGLVANAAGVDSPRVGVTVVSSEVPTVKPQPAVPAASGQLPPGNTAASVVKPTRVRVSQGVMTGLCVTKVQPLYPADAKAARVQGSVVLSVLINKTGDVESVKLINGDPLLAPAAIDAVKRWKYRPYILNGTPVAVETTATIVFTLAGG
jgi:TonB family protein